MTVEEAIVDRLLSISAVTALVSTRVRMLRLAQGEQLPAVRVQLIDEPSVYHLRGGNKMTMARVQVDAFASESSGADPYAAAAELAEAIHGDEAGSGLSGWSGAVGSPSRQVFGVFRVDRDVTYDADELRLVRIRQDYMVSSQGN